MVVRARWRASLSGRNRGLTMAEDDKAPARSFPPNTIHVIRTAQQIHVVLSQMADQKANMLLAATFVIFTIAIGQVRSMAEPLPVLILGGGAFFSALLAWLSA